jgi:hypothetical protein
LKKKGKVKILGYSDSDMAGDVDDRKSIQKKPGKLDIPKAESSGIIFL